MTEVATAATATAGMNLFEFMSANPWLSFFLAWLGVCAIQGICRAIASFGRKE